MKQLTILGSTGSIGTSTLAVVRANPQRFAVKALVAGRNVEMMTGQCLEFRPTYAAMSDERAANELRLRLKDLNVATEVLSGEQAGCDLAALEDVDQVMAAIVGAAGLLPTPPPSMLENRCCWRIKNRWSLAAVYLWRR